MFQLLWNSFLLCFDISQARHACHWMPRCFISFCVCLSVSLSLPPTCARLIFSSYYCISSELLVKIIDYKVTRQAAHTANKYYKLSRYLRINLKLHLHLSLSFFPPISRVGLLLWNARETAQNEHKNEWLNGWRLLSAEALDHILFKLDIYIQLQS